MTGNYRLRRDVTRLDHHHLQSWYALRQSGAGLATMLDRMRRHPEVFRHICHTDTAAAEIAVQRGWEVDADHSVERSDAEVAHAHQTVVTALAAIHAQRVTPR